MDTRKIWIAFIVLLSLYVANAFAQRTEEEEINVVILYCQLDETKNPPEIIVKAFSKNTTPSKIPLLTEDKPCAQALHELLTAGFEIVNKETAWNVFLLTRKDRVERGR